MGSFNCDYKSNLYCIYIKFGRLIHIITLSIFACTSEGFNAEQPICDRPNEDEEKLDRNTEKRRRSSVWTKPINEPKIWETGRTCPKNLTPFLLSALYGKSDVFAEFLWYYDTDDSWSMGKERTIDGYNNRNISNPYNVCTTDTKENVLHLLLKVRKSVRITKY